jgi:hypothetical protein
MATESNKMTQDMENKDTDSLTDRQIKVLPYIVASSTYSEGCKRAKVSRKTFYRWLDDPAFRSELEQKQKAISDRAMGMLSQNVTQAIERLAGLLGDEDKRLGRLAAKDVLEYHLKFVELKEIENRLAAIEERLDK